MDINTLQAFLIIGEEQHITRAARRLQIAQPNLTRTMRKLEAELGFELFDRRKKRQFALTVAGQIFLQEIKPMLAQYEHALQISHQAAQHKKDKLVVGYMAAATFTILPAIIQRYHQMPEVDLIMRDLGTLTHTACLQSLREYRLDVAFNLITPLPSQGIAYECISRVPMGVALPEHHPLANLQTIPLAVLSEETWIWTSKSLYPQVYDALIALCQQAGFTPHIVQTVGQPHTVLSMVRAGIGIVFVSEWTQRGLTQPGVIYRPLSDHIPIIDLNVLWREHEQSSLVHTFLHHVREVISVVRK